MNICSFLKSLEQRHRKQEVKEREEIILNLNCLSNQVEMCIYLSASNLEFDLKSYECNPADKTYIPAFFPDFSRKQSIFSKRKY